MHDLFFLFQSTLAVMALIIAIAMIFVFWRFHGLMRWRKSLTQELKALKKENKKLEMSSAKQKAQQIVIDTCEQIQGSYLVAISEFEQIPDYICKIAACYYPDKKNPEQCITIGNCLHIIQEMAFRIDQLFKQPGLRRFRHLRIRHINSIYNRLKKLQKNPIMAFYLRYRKTLQKISLLRMIVLPDPFSWIFFLSNRFTIITLTRYLLFEIYLYAGQLSVQAYGQTSSNQQISFSQEELEGLMTDLEQLQAIDSEMDNPELIEIRKKHLGFGRGLMANLSIYQLRKAVVESSHVISGQYFHDAQKSLAEACIGPILERSRFWLKTVNRIQTIPVIRQMTHVKLETIFQAKFLIDSIPPKMKQIIISTSRVYQWAKWPITIYRLARNTTPLGIATSIGWIVTRNCIVFYIYHFSFYVACNELNAVYLFSSDEYQNMLQEQPK